MKRWHRQDKGPGRARGDGDIWGHWGHHERPRNKPPKSSRLFTTDAILITVDIWVFFFLIMWSMFAKMIVLGRWTAGTEEAEAAQELRAPAPDGAAALQERDRTGRRSLVQTFSRLSCGRKLFQISSSQCPQHVSSLNNVPFLLKKYALVKEVSERCRRVPSKTEPRAPDWRTALYK